MRHTGGGQRMQHLSSLAAWSCSTPGFETGGRRNTICALAALQQEDWVLDAAAQLLHGGDRAGAGKVLRCDPVIQVGQFSAPLKSFKRAGRIVWHFFLTRCASCGHPAGKA